MQRMRELAVQAANDTNVESDREATDAEIQQLKEQIDTILGETEFNTRPIWDVNAEGKKLVGTVKKPAVTVTSVDTQYRDSDLDNTNKFRISNGNYSIRATEDGMQLSWTDYYGDTHKVPADDANGVEQYVPWPEPDAPEHPEMPGERYLAQKVSVNFNDYMSAEDKALGLKLAVSFSIAEGSTVTDLADSLNGTSLYQSYSTYFDVESDGSSGISPSNGYFSSYKMMLALNSTETDAGGAAVPGMDVTRVDDGFLESTSANNATVVPDFTNMEGGWEFQFESPAYPGVTFTATARDSVSYRVESLKAEHEDLWWEYVEYDHQKYQSTLWYTANGDSTLESIEEALTNPTNNLLTHDVDAQGNGTEGTIQLVFDLTASSDLYISKDGGNINVGNDVGMLYMYINVDEDDTVADVVNKMKTFQHMDINSGTSNRNISIAFSGPHTKMIDSPLWEATNEMNVQAGANEQQNIRLEYDAIRTYNIGLTSTNVLTREDAGTAISEVDDAMEIISQQRSYFGAIQNRLEHAQLNADNTGENLQASESRIRDANMAEETVVLSKHTILEQAAQAVMAQENRATEGVLKLLQ